MCIALLALGCRFNSGDWRIQNKLNVTVCSSCL